LTPRAYDRAVPETVEVAVVGGGQAGLSLSHELSHAGVEHLVLEQGRVGQTWRGRWDSFCLVIPNWTVQLPGGHYDGDDPDGFMPRDDIVDHLVRYADRFGAPVREGVEVSRLSATDDGGFLLSTSSGDIRARRVVLASGGYQKPHRPPGADQLPASLHVIDVEGYTNPEALPPGKVLVMGSGQTGCQLAEDLTGAGRDVFLACGRAPWMHRQLEGRDTTAWIVDTPFLEMKLTDLPSPLMRLGANPQASGRGGGHDLHYRTLQASGVNLLGHFLGAEDGVAQLAPDLAESVAFGDARYGDLCELIRKTCAARGDPAPEMPPPPPFEADPPEQLDLDGFGAAIFTAGFRPDYTSWVEFPAAFDDMGYPLQEDGSSTIVPGLHFMGVHFQRKRKSATFIGVGEDAAVLAETIAETHSK
jgi:putative flavoprotein involved in K+ transport